MDLSILEGFFKEVRTFGECRPVINVRLKAKERQQLKIDHLKSESPCSSYSSTVNETTEIDKQLKPSVETTHIPEPVDRIKPLSIHTSITTNTALNGAFNLTPTNQNDPFPTYLFDSNLELEAPEEVENELEDIEKKPDVIKKSSPCNLKRKSLKILRKYFLRSSPLKDVENVLQHNFKSKSYHLRWNAERQRLRADNTHKPFAFGSHKRVVMSTRSIGCKRIKRLASFTRKVKKEKGQTLEDGIFCAHFNIYMGALISQALENCAGDPDDISVQCRICNMKVFIRRCRSHVLSHSTNENLVVSNLDKLLMASKCFSSMSQNLKTAQFENVDEGIFGIRNG